MEHTIVVAGSGKTSRANVEALIEDYLYPQTDDITVAIPFVEGLSEGQTWAAQVAIDKKAKVLFYSPSEPSQSLSMGDLILTERPYRDAVGENSVVMILWDDEDPICHRLARYCKDMSVPCMDLTNGLYEVSG